MVVETRTNLLISITCSGQFYDVRSDIVQAKIFTYFLHLLIFRHAQYGRKKLTSMCNLFLRHYLRKNIFLTGKG